MAWEEVKWRRGWVVGRVVKVEMIFLYRFMVRVG
jgi:hypothetical protein